MDAVDLFLAGLQLYFITMNWTVERSYCAAPITEESDCFLCPETYEFCAAHNPLFLARPEWLRLATCFSAYAFCIGYLVIFCVEINQCVGCTRQFFTKSFLGNDVAVLARSSGEETALPRHRAGVAA